MFGLAVVSASGLRRKRGITDYRRGRVLAARDSAGTKKGSLMHDGSLYGVL